MDRRMRGVTFAAVAAVLSAAGIAPTAAGDSFAVRLDKVEVLRLDVAASIVVVGNPGIADVTVENPRLLFVIGRAPGETNLMVFDTEAREIANYELVVVGERDRHVTVNRNTGLLSTLSCDPRCIEVPNPSEVERQRQFAGAGQAKDEETSPAPVPQAAPAATPAPPPADGGEDTGDQG